MVREQTHICLMLALAEKKFGKALDGHVGDGKESVELDSEILPQLALVVAFKFFLWRGKEQPLRGGVNRIEQRN